MWVGEVVTNRNNKVFAAKLLPGGSVPPSESPVCTLTHTHMCMLSLTYTQTHPTHILLTHAYTFAPSHSNTLTQHIHGAQDTHTRADTLAHIHMLSGHTPPLTVTYTHI